jgi:hypothetical protein
LVELVHLFVQLPRYLYWRLQGAPLTIHLLQAGARVALNPLMRQVLSYVVARLVHRVVARLLLLLLLVAGAI